MSANFHLHHTDTTVASIYLSFKKDVVTHKQMRIATVASLLTIKSVEVSVRKAVEKSNVFNPSKYPDYVFLLSSLLFSFCIRAIIKHRKNSLIRVLIHPIGNSIFTRNVKQRRRNKTSKKVRKLKTKINIKSNRLLSR